jgi:hypothetical protein
MICGNCGQHTNYREAECHFCHESNHRSDCSRDRTCTCHTENLKTWNGKTSQKEIANVDGKSGKSAKKAD